MSRNGYVDWDGYGEGEQWAMIRHAGALKAAINGKRGQAMLRDLLAALDAMPEKRLIPNELEMDGEVCALGALGKVRGIDMTNIDPEDAHQVSEAFGVAEKLAREVVYQNDEGEYVRSETPEQRWARMRRWVERQLFDTPKPKTHVAWAIAMACGRKP